MRELKSAEIQLVSGGNSTGGEIAMAAAGAWSSTVAGAAVGTVIGGPKGTIAGAAVGFAMGVLTATGFILSRK